ncbi:hypothetical protein IAR55_002776 [Kwoniella newhampshirensis]|uniref:Retinoic acid induced 16-like protein-domain-containing protein n=1 Tax=Kwoniella newhampshirensis TaxID=1651941 RepID=A0AAW0YNN2_9TREE
MEVSTFFTRLLQTSKEPVQSSSPDELGDFDAAWLGVKETLEHPDERQLVRGIASTQVPAQLRHIVDALVYESNRTDEDTTGACLEYFLKNDLLAQLERLCEADRPHGIKGEVLRATNNLVVLLSERFLVHNAVHRPLRRLLRSCVGDEPEEKVDGGVRLMGAAGRSPLMDRRAGNDDIGEDLVDLMCILCSKMRAYPPLLLIFFHDKAWSQPNPSIPASPGANRLMSPPPSAHTTHSDPTRDSAKPTHHFEFLLFSYLLRYVHREGRIGDFARAGLLFLFDIAFLAPNDEGGDTLQMHKEKDDADPLQAARDALGEFILDGDFADVMAAGLGAIYSLLPSKLQVPSISAQAESAEENRASTSGGMYLGQGGGSVDSDVMMSTDPEVRIQLDMLLKLFGFLQDIIYRCNSPIHHADPESSTITTTHVIGSAISETILDAIQSSFLDNVLYPSILECSSLDGSAVAVLTYLNVVFSNLDDGPLLHRLLSFLLDTESAHDLPQIRHPGSEAKRKTEAMDFVHSPAHVVNYFAKEGRFTLKDLILDNLHSKEWSASTAALRLLRTLLVEHCNQAVQGLLSSTRDSTGTALARTSIALDLDSFTDESFLPRASNSADSHLQETELYSALTSRIDPLQTSAELAAGYAGYLADMRATLQIDPCSRTSHMPLQSLGDEEKYSLARASDRGSVDFQHRLSATDPLVRSLLDSFTQFLSKTPDENVALTGVLTGLTLCPNRSLAGWVLYDLPAVSNSWTKSHGNRSRRPSSSVGKETSDTEDSDIDLETFDDTVSSDPSKAKQPVDLPAIYQILRDLVIQISQFRIEVPGFDRLLSERRQGLLFADHLAEAMNVMLEVETANSVFGLPVTPQQQFKRPKGRPSLASSIKSFWTPKKKVDDGVVTPTPSKDTGVVRNLFRTASPSANADREGDEDAAEEEDGQPTPLKSHHERTTLSLGPQSSQLPIKTGPQSTAVQSQSRPLSAPRQSLGDEQSMVSEREAKIESDAQIQDSKTVPMALSMILDNCVILEEFLKEIVAVITARRALGIDQVGYI